MADESQEPAPVPLGAQVMRKMHATLKALHGECSKSVGALDDCEAKTTIGEHMSTMEQSFSGMAKAFGKLYKGVDLEEEEKKPELEAGTNRTVTTNDDKKEPERQIEKSDGEDDEDDGLTRVEKSILLSRARQLESKIRHEERLQRMARLRAAN